MKVSFVVPVYNVEGYLKRCLDSLMNSIGKKNNVEILIIDDGSTDKSGELADKYSENKNVVKVFHKENGGLSDARNYGFARSSGEYVIFIDSDDEVDSNLMMSMLDIISSSKSDIILWDAKEIGEDSQLISSEDQNYFVHKGLSNKKKYKGIDIVKDQLMDHFDFLTTVWLGAYRREFLYNNQLFFEKGLIHEDELWTTKVLLVSQSVEYYNIPVYLYRQRENSIMNKVSKNYEKNIRDIIYIYTSLYSYVEWKEINSGFEKKLKGNITRRYLHSLCKFESYKYKKELKKVNKRDLFKYSSRTIDKVRSIVLMISPYLFCKLKKK